MIELSARQSPETSSLKNRRCESPFVVGSFAGGIKFGYLHCGQPRRRYSRFLAFAFEYASTLSAVILLSLIAGVIWEAWRHGWPRVRHVTCPENRETC